MKTLLSAVSNFSILRGVLSPQTICKTAVNLGYETVALTDYNNLYGLPEFIRNCTEYNIDCIIASELVDKNGTSALIYAEAADGFSSLCTVISRFHCDTGFRLTDCILKNSAGLHIVTDNLPLIQSLKEHCSVYYRMRRPRRPPPQIFKDKIPCIIAPSMVFTGK